MSEITYVTDNYKRFMHTKELLEENNINLDYFGCSFKKPKSKDIAEVTEREAKAAFKELGNPVIVTKTGFYIEDYPKNRDYPGVLFKESGISSNVEQLLRDMKGTSNRNCSFINCLTYYDGEDLKQFYCSNFGTLVEYSSEVNNLFDVFIPVTNDKPVSKLSEEEKQKIYDSRISVIKQFIKWYKSKEEEPKRLNKSLV